MQTRSLRFRLTIWYTAVLTAGLALFGSLLWLSLRHELNADLERDLGGRAARFENFFRSESAEADVHLSEELEEFCQALPPGSYINVRGSKSFTFRYPAGSAAQLGLRVLDRTFSVNGETFDLEVGAPLTDIRHFLNLLRWLLWSLIPVVIALACVGGAWLSGRALKPVQDVTDAALAISIENLSGRLPVPASGDEIAGLATVLNSMLARLEAAVTTLSQFAGNASHELRTPLAVIRTTAELALRRERTPEAYRTALQEIASESDRMTQLIEDLLALARSDAGAVDMPRAAIDMREVVTEVSREMMNLADAAGIQVKAVLGDRPAMISANRPAMHRLFMVLLDNALKYSHAGGDVILSVTRGEGLISVSVEDFGEGIGEADLPHIFERFYQADQSRSIGGHGLGLSLAESIAQSHGIAIDVRSTLGKGTILRVVFPERDAQTPVSVATTTTAANTEALAGS
jgi:two-component system, OmpR family, heavy metal sensor histidine kinase CusS